MSLHYVFIVFSILSAASAFQFRPLISMCKTVALDRNRGRNMEEYGRLEDLRIFITLRLQFIMQCLDIGQWKWKRNWSGVQFWLL